MGVPSAGVEVDVNDETAVLRPWGELDVAGAAVIRPLLEQVTAGPSTQYLFDMQKVSFLDGSGLRELVRAILQVRSKGGRASLVNGRPHVERLLAVTGYNRVLDRFPTDLDW